MRELPPGWATDLAVLRHSGSLITDHGDHVVVRTPQNPDFHWGNCVFVLDERTVADADRWVEVFTAAHPEADWVAVGLIVEPDDATAWAAHGVAIEGEDVLTTREPPITKPLAAGYIVRRIAGDDWEQVVAAEVADNALTGAYDPALHERFARAQTALRCRLSDTDVAAFFGAFADGVLASSLGIVVWRHGPLPVGRHRRSPPPPRAGRAPARGCRSLVGGEGLPALGDHHRSRESGRQGLPQCRFRAGHQQRPGVSGAHALSGRYASIGVLRARDVRVRAPVAIS